MKIYRVIETYNIVDLQNKTGELLNELFTKYPNGKIEVFNSNVAQGASGGMCHTNSIVFETNEDVLTLMV